MNKQTFIIKSANGMGSCPDLNVTVSADFMNAFITKAKQTGKVACYPYIGSVCFGNFDNIDDAPLYTNGQESAFAIVDLNGVIIWERF